MASYVKNDPACVSTSQIVSVGNVSLRGYSETDPRYLSDPATAALVIDVIASPGYEAVSFRDITLVLQILGPSGARFVDHGGRNNYRWDIPDGAGGWVENAVPTSLLRIRWGEGTLLSGPNNGLSHYVGIAGLPDAAEFQFSAIASAQDVRATASSCSITISGLTPGGQALTGYLR